MTKSPVYGVMLMSLRDGMYMRTISDRHDRGWAPALSSNSERWLPADEDRAGSSSSSFRNGRSDLGTGRPWLLASGPVLDAGGAAGGWYVVGFSAAAGDAERELAVRDWVPSDLRCVRAHESPQLLQSVFGPSGPCIQTKRSANQGTGGANDENRIDGSVQG
jgi:hypothetical protein